MRESADGAPISEEMHYVRAEQTFQMEGQFSDEKRLGIEKSKVVLAFPLDSTGSAKPEPTSHVFAFLPIRQMGFTFSIQADFILNSSREEVLTDRPWNQLLKAGVAEVFVKAVETFKKTELLALSYLKYIPAEGEIVDPFFRPLRKSIITKLASAKCLLSASGNWEKPSDLRTAEKSFRTLFPPKIAKELFNFDYIDSRMQGGSELLQSLGAKGAGLSEVLSVFKAHGAWLQNQPLEWRAKFYAYVANNQRFLLAIGLLKCPCLPISDGSYVVPTEANVFFPLGRGKKYGFESELVFIDNDLYEEALKHSDQVIGLFHAMKVRPDEPYDLVNAHILPRHEGDAWTTSDFKALVGHLRYVKDKLRSYLESALANGKSEAQAYKLLRDGIWIGTKKLLDGTWTFGRVNDLYLSKEYKPKFCIESLLAEALDSAKLVSPDYLAAKPKDPDADAESWRLFFANLGVCMAPAIEAHGANWSCSDELQLLLDSPNPAVRRATLECINRHWENYAACLSHSFKIGRTTHSSVSTEFAMSLRKTPAPTRKRATVPLAEAYYPTAELKTLLGDSLPYVEAALDEAMLDACGVTHRLDAKALVKRLKQFKAEGSGTIKQVQAIYRVLDERLWSSDAAYIKQAFNLDGLIRVKGERNEWRTPSEVAWSPSSTFLDSLYPPIHSLYRDFSKFFTSKLGIPKELPTAKWIEALTHLSTLKDPEERKAEALTIYRRANRDLAPKFGREVQVPEWIETFQSEEVFVNHRGKIVSNDHFLFANDVPAIAALFEDEEDLAFLAVPNVDVPRLNRLLDAADVSRLSDAITLEVSNAESGSVNEDLTKRVRRSVYYFARVLYAKRNEAFEQALSDGRFARLRDFEVAEVPQVEIVVSLWDYSRETTVDIALSENRVLYRNGARSVKDLLAAELSKFLGASSDLADTFARVLMESEDDNIEDFLVVRNIGALPSDLREALDRAISLADEGEENDTATASVEQSDEASPPTSDDEDTPASGETIRPNSDDDALPKGLTFSRSPVVPLTDNADEHEGQGTSPIADPPPELTPVKIPASRNNGERRAPSGGTSSRTSPSPASALRQSGEHGAHGAANVGETSSQGSELTPQTHSESSSEGAVGSGGNYHSRTVPSHSKLRRGGSEQPRAKSGRLLSYAASPGEADQPHPDDDPAKVAAREATGRAAVAYFMTTQAGRWKSLVEMPHNNPGFDVRAIADDGQEEFIEVKGQSSAWTEEGVALTPTELMTAQQKGDRYWLCIVEYAQDDRRRQLYLVRNPYGLTQQFRFDVGWKTAAENVARVPLKPEKEMYIDIPDVGRGRILSVRDKGKFFNLHVILEDGSQVNKLFNPAKMTLSEEPTWQE